MYVPEFEDALPFAVLTSDASGNYDTEALYQQTPHGVVVKATLEGMYVKVVDYIDSEPSVRVALAPFSGTRSVPVDFPGDPETNIYYHVNRARSFLAAAPIGFHGLDSVQIVAETNYPLDEFTCGWKWPPCDWDSNAQADGQQDPPHLRFGAREEWDQSADVIIHEYMHLVIHSIYGRIGSKTPLYGTYEEQAMNEGLADYWAVVVNGDGDGNMACDEGLPVCRNFGGEQRRYNDPDDFNPDDPTTAHDAGKVISGALWDMRASLGAPQVADRLTFEAMKTKPTSFSSLLQQILNRDAANNGCVNVDAIRNAFSGHGISISTVLNCQRIHIGPGQTFAFTASVPPGQSQAVFQTSWAGSDVVMSLEAPSGGLIDRSTAAPDVEHNLGADFERYRVDTPEAGDWTVTLFGADVPPEGEDVLFSLTFSDLPQPDLIEREGDTLWINVGARAGERNIATGEIDESVTVSLVGHEYVANGFGATDTEPASGITRIMADSAEGNDELVLFDVSVPAELDGGGDNDVLTSGSGADLLIGGPGLDIISADAGADYVDGGPGEDQLSGGPGADIIFGSDDNDQILGEGGPDQLLGGSGDDEIHGGDGMDEMTGDGGA
ncbi:MAG: hypothetical protein ABIP58_05340, partial [Dehalococcoidia bacterium]